MRPFLRIAGLTALLIPALLMLGVLVDPHWHTWASGIAVSGYNRIQDEGSDLAQRLTLNFTGTGVTCSDGGGKTTCNIPGSSGGITNSIGTVAALPGAGSTSGDQYNATDGFYKYIWNGAAWTTWIGSWSVQEPTSATFAAGGGTGGTPTIDTTHGGIIFSQSNAGGDNVPWRVKSLAFSPSFTVTGCFYAPSIVSPNNFITVGLRESATGKGYTIGSRTSLQPVGIRVNSNTSWSGNCSTNNTSGPTAGLMCVKITDDGTNLKAYWANDPFGFNHFTACDQTVAANFTTAPDQFGIAIQSEDANADAVISFVHFLEQSGIH